MLDSRGGGGVYHRIVEEHFVRSGPLAVSSSHLAAKQDRKPCRYSGPQGGQQRGRLLEGISAHTDLGDIALPNENSTVTTDPVSREPTPGFVSQEVRQSRRQMISTEPVAGQDFGSYGADNPDGSSRPSLISKAR